MGALIAPLLSSELACWTSIRGHPLRARYQVLAGHHLVLMHHMHSVKACSSLHSHRICQCVSCAAGSESEGVPRLPSSVHVPTSAWPRALAVHPHTHEIVAATAGDCSLLLLDRVGADNSHEGQPEPE